jgi:nicotinamide-nucleotide amidase
MDDPAFAAAQLVTQRLRERQLRLVLAESCTGGLAAATLARIPGISEWLCGSAVVYRLETKHHWLDVPPALFHASGPGVVSREVAEAMAQGALAHTPEADIAAAITGHLGPNAPDDQEGLVWMAVLMRARAPMTAVTERLSESASPGLTVRETRQQTATAMLLRVITEALR